MYKLWFVFQLLLCIRRKSIQYYKELYILYNMYVFGRYFKGNFQIFLLITQIQRKKLKMKKKS